MSKLLLIDGDQYLFTCTAAAEDEVRFNVELGEPNWNEPPIHVIFSNPIRARELFDEAMERLFERFETRDHLLCFSTPADFRFGKDAQPNFRLGVDATYKNNRQLSRKPLCYAQLRGDIEQAYSCKNFIGLEADDVMGILATRPHLRQHGIHGQQRIIVSQDKDMKTIPTTVWNGKDLVTYTEAEADYWHLYQTLVGDITDGYKGCPGVGAVKAEKLLNGWPCDKWNKEIRTEVWKSVVAAYEKAGLTEDDAITQARLARILRWEDWDNTKKEPILWTPRS